MRGGGADPESIERLYSYRQDVLLFFGRLALFILYISLCIYLFFCETLDFIPYFMFLKMFETSFENLE